MKIPQRLLNVWNIITLWTRNDQQIFFAPPRTFWHFSIGEIHAYPKKKLHIVERVGHLSYNLTLALFAHSLAPEFLNVRVCNAALRQKPLDHFAFNTLLMTFLLNYNR